MNAASYISDPESQAVLPRMLPCIAPLFVPADRPERYAKAAASGADAIVIDLEDAVAPEKKGAARAELYKAKALPKDSPVYIRLNGTTTPWYAEDVSAARGLEVTGVILPKAENIAGIASLAAALGGREIIALIESAEGLAAARDIARAGTVARLAFGSIDFCADLGVAHTREALLMARSELVLASRLGGLAPPLDGVTTDIGNASLAEDDARYASALGFGGKLCIHPVQIRPVFQGFTPGAEEIAWAERVLAASAEGAEKVGEAMVDAPVRARARQIIARRDRVNLKRDAAL